MSRYIITYDLSKPGRNYDDLYQRIKSYGTWAKIAESSWAIVTDQTTVGGTGLPKARFGTATISSLLACWVLLRGLG